MKIFVTGTDGYIGCVLAARLLDQGHQVQGFDSGYYREGWLFTAPGTLSRTPQTVIGDVRQIAPEHLEGCDAIVHLAELSNDPLGESDREVTFDINHRGTVHLAHVARQCGIRRFVYTSSCSVYGVSDAEFVDESSEVSPQTAYAECKVKVERDLAAMAGTDFEPVFLRNATAYGASPRMRFDIVLNNLAGLAWTTKKIAMTSDGSPWRPIVHIEDICSAIICALESPKHAIQAQIFNVGDTNENYRIREIAEIVGGVFPDCEITFGPSGGDNRSYRVSFDKIRKQLPGFACEWTARDGAEQLRQLFERVALTKAEFDLRPYTRLKCLKHLLQTKQINRSYYWNSQ